MVFLIGGDFGGTEHHAFYLDGNGGGSARGFLGNYENLSVRQKAGQTIYQVRPSIRSDDLLAIGSHKPLGRSIQTSQVVPASRATTSM